MTSIQVDTIVAASAQAAWNAWTDPRDIVQWNAASDEWHTTSADIDLRPGGRFSYRMEAKDGSAGFDFAGEFTAVIEPQRIDFTLDDGRKVTVRFEPGENGTTIRQAFEAHPGQPADLQRQGWQAILDRFASLVASRI